MAKNRSEQSTYPSRYSPGGWVTEAQYIIELLCEAKAKQDNTDLPTQFWKLPEWKKFFSASLRATHSALKKWEGKAIIAAIKEKRIWSLRPKWVHEVIQGHQKTLDGKRLAAEAEKNLKQKEPTKHTISTKRRRSRRTGINALLESDEALANGEEEN